MGEIRAFLGELRARRPKRVLRLALRLAGAERGSRFLYSALAAVLKYADAVLKGYATAISVLLTGVLSMVLFGTELSVEYALGMTNVLAAVFLYNAQDLEKHAW